MSSTGSGTTPSHRSGECSAYFLTATKRLGIFERADDEIVKKTRVLQVLRALPGYGASKVAALMATSGVDEKRRVGGLTGAQRARS